MSKKGNRKYFYDDFDDSDDEIDYQYKNRTKQINQQRKTQNFSNSQNSNFPNSPKKQPQTDHNRLNGIRAAPRQYIGNSFNDFDYDDYDEEEDFDKEDKIVRLFDIIENRYDISQCDRNKIKEAFKKLDYQQENLIQMLKKGEFGPIIPKRKILKQLKQSQMVESVEQPKEEKQTSEIEKNEQITKFKNIEQHSNQTKIKLADVKTAFETSKKHINLVIIGHVDAGKSSLIGHILLLNGFISKNEMDKIHKESNEIGRPQDELSWIMAEDDTERERGVTIDVSMTNFETIDRQITVLDAPGHRDFVPNMIAGASQADSAILVVDASNPNIEKGQTGEHLLLCRSLGVKNLIVCINKIDTVRYSQESFLKVQQKIENYLKSIGWSAIAYIPMKATNEVDLLTPTRHMKWYKGPTILDAINSLEPPKLNIENPFYLSISECTEGGNGPNSITITGRVDSGYICKNDNVHVLPADLIQTVSHVLINGEKVPFAYAGQICDVVLNTNKLPIESITVGSAICDPKLEVHLSNQFKAQMRTFIMKRPLLSGTPLFFYRQAVDVPLNIERFISILDKKTKKAIQKHPKFVSNDSLTEVSFSLINPIPLEPDSISNSLGRFIVRANGETIGFARVTSITPYEKVENDKNDNEND